MTETKTKYYKPLYEIYMMFDYKGYWFVTEKITSHFLKNTHYITHITDSKVSIIPKIHFKHTYKATRKLLVDLLNYFRICEEEYHWKKMEYDIDIDKNIELGMKGFRY